MVRRKIALSATLALATLAPLACGGSPMSETRSPTSATTTKNANKNRGVLLADLTWLEAERILTQDRVVVLPLGAAAKEHGPHLRLDNDLRLAEGLRDRLLETEDVVIAPTISYHFYPAFVEYPGSTTLRHETARDLVIDIVKSLAAHGPRRFYVLNTGVSTVRPLNDAKAALESEGIVFGFTDLRALEPLEKRIGQQEAGTHADETETSMMLTLTPDRVDMTKAVKDIHPRRPPRLTRREGGEGTYSASGVYGDATLATRAKGDALVLALVAAIRSDIEAVRARRLPSAP